MPQLKAEYKWLLIIAILSFGVYLNALSGDFVYDDKRQILMNTLIQEPSLSGKALTSDVWAFKGDGSVAASNYYRPTFVLWLIINFALFGANPFGWHMTNVILHTSVCLLGYLLLRRLRLTEVVAFSIAALFAVHPAHVESVAWISGSPDLLFSLFFFGSLWFAIAGREKRASSWQLIASAILYLIALGAKEIGFLCLPIYFLVFRSSELENGAEANRRAATRCIPFVGIAIVFFFARLTVIGGISHPVEDSVTLQQTLLSVPALIIFYVRQLVFPLRQSVNYPLRPVSEIDLSNFVLPILFSATVVAILWYAARRSYVGKLGFALFVLTLIPAFNLTAFPSEQIVHDRYLYFPLLGFLMIVVPAADELFKKFIRVPSYAIATVMTALISALAFATVLNNRIWANDVALWQHAAAIDTRSAFTLSQLASSLANAGRVNESIEAYERSLAIRPAAAAYLGQGQNYADIGDNDRAVEYARKVIETPLEKINAYTLYQAYELLAVALSNERKFAEAESSLRTARTQLPIYRAALTEKLAVVLYNENRKLEALSELESAKDRARIELLPSSKNVFLRLGMLDAELGNKQAAAAYLNEFLAATSKTSIPEMQNDRRQAADLLRRLR